VGVNRQRLIVGVHVLVALGLGGLGIVRLVGGDPIGGGINVATAAFIVAVGVFVARRE